MKLLIDIPEHIYEHAKEMSEDSGDEFEAMRAIANGSPQRTGQWIQKGVVGGGEYIYECSECHHTDTRSRILEVPFCWFCGARMKSKDEGLTELKYLIDEKVNYLRSRAKWEEADAFEKKMRNIIARLEEEE